MPIALAALKNSGGTLHVHGNVVTGTETKWAANQCEILRKLVEKGAAGDESWQFRVKYISRVKSYAPRIVHIVVDIECGPNVIAPKFQADIELAPRFEVNMVENPTEKQFLEDIVARREPCIIRGADVGRAQELWTPSYLQVSG